MPRWRKPKAAHAEIAAGRYRGPLHGVPVALKDLFWTKDFPTAAGTAVHRDFRPDQDATVVRRLNEAGAVVLGKLQLTEGAYSDHHPSVTAAEKSVECRLLAGHFVQWRGSRNGGGALLWRARLRYRRFDPLAMRRQRADRIEAELGTRQPLRRVRTGRDTGPCRDNRPERGRCRRDAWRHRRTRPRRSNSGIRCCARLSGRG